MKRLILAAILSLILGCGGSDGGGGGGGGDGGGGGGDGNKSPLGMPSNFKAVPTECAVQYPTSCQVTWIFYWVDNATEETAYQFSEHREGGKNCDGYGNPCPILDRLHDLPADTIRYGGGGTQDTWTTFIADETMVWTFKVRVTNGTNYSSWSASIVIDISDFCGYCSANPP